MDYFYSSIKVLFLLRGDYLYDDKEFYKEIEKLREIKPNTVKIKWHGKEEEISSKSDFWDSEDVAKTEAGNFIRRYYRDILRELYDYESEGITIDYLNFKNHGPKRDKIINEENKALFFSFLHGTATRIIETISDFFEIDENINPYDAQKGMQENYKTVASLINDNTLGSIRVLRFFKKTERVPKTVQLAD